MKCVLTQPPACAGQHHSRRCQEAGDQARVRCWERHLGQDKGLPLVASTGAACTRLDDRHKLSLHECCAQLTSLMQLGILLSFTWLYV